MTHDERRDPRKPTALQIRFKSATIAEFVEKHAKDISRGGMFIKMKAPFAAGTLIKFDVRITSESFIHGVGRVAWCRKEGSAGTPPGMGVKFIKVDEKSIPILEAVLAEKDNLQLSSDEGVSFDDPLPKPARASGTPETGSRTVLGVPLPSRAAGGSTGRDTDSPSGRLSTAETKKPPPPRSSEEKRAAAPKSPEQKATSSDDEAPGLGFLGAATRGGEEKVDREFLSGTRDDFLADVDSALDTALGATAAEGHPVSPSSAQKGEKADPSTGGQSTTASDGKSRDHTGGTDKAPSSKKTSGMGSGEKLEKPGGAPLKSAVAEAGAPRKGDGTAALIIVVTLLAVAGGVAWFLLRDSDGSASGEPSTTAETGPSQPEIPVVTTAPASVDTGQASTASASGDTAPSESDAPAAAAETASVTVTTQPKGAAVSVDGVLRDETTPLVISGLPQGRRVEIAIRKFGFASHVEALEPTAAEVPMAVKLKPLKKTVTVETEPRGAEVAVGDRRLGRTPFTVTKNFLAPSFVLSISRDGYESMTHSVTESDWVETEDAVTLNVQFSLEKEAPARKRGRGPDLDADAALKAILAGKSATEAVSSEFPGASNAEGTSEPEVKSEREPEVKSEPKPQPEVEPDPEPEPAVKPEPEPAPEAKPEPKRESKPKNRPSSGGIEENPF